MSHRLAEIHDALVALPDGPSVERFNLLKERDGLRAEAEDFKGNVDETRSDSELKAELASLRRRRKQVIGERTGYVTSKGGNNAGPSSGAWVKLGAKSMAAGGLDHLNVRISHIEQVLASRRNQPSS